MGILDILVGWWGYGDQIGLVLMRFDEDNIS